MLLRRYKQKNQKESKDIANKSLSNRMRIFYHLVSPKNKRAKALQRACPDPESGRQTVRRQHGPDGSFTVEAAFVLPLFLFAAVVVLGLFPVLKLQTEVNCGLQYAARLKAASYQEEDATLGSLVSKSPKTLFCSYMEEHGYESSVLTGGLDSISLAGSDLSGDYVTLVASYDAQLPISFWNLTSLPVKQCVRMKKWTGTSGTDEDGDGGAYVYVTPTGSAYHTSTDCPYLKLSIQSVAVSDLSSLRNKNGGIYYPCSCYNGTGLAYITNYGTEYHSDLECSSLKRTIYKVSSDAAEGLHACPKCGS